jgi:GTPase SAR1 family protein
MNKVIAIRNLEVFSHYYTPTLGINLEKKDVKIDNLLVSISIWDTAGQ